MKVLVVGFPKTGTKSIEKALGILGYKVADYVTINIKHFDTWKRYMEGHGSLDDLRTMYSDLDAAADMPVNMYWEDFLKVFPKIKLIFMMRDEDEWLRSWHKHWAVRNVGKLSFPLAFFSATARKWIAFYQMEARTFFNSSPKSFRKMYEGIPDEVLKKVYRRHNRNVLENAPPDQLLHFDFKDGWEPICKFLGKPVPSVDFPHVNKNAGLVNDQRANHPVYEQMYREMHTALLLIACFIFLLICTYYFLLK